MKVRDYVKGKGLEKILVPLYGTWENAEDIPFDSLPDKYVLKCNHGCAYNILVPDASRLDINAAIEQLNSWLSITYKGGASELHYADIKPHLVMAEKFLCEEGEDEMTDFKIHCINGNPEYIQVCYDRDDRGVAHRASYSLDWKPLHWYTEPECEVERPEHLEEMVEYAKILSSDFPFVRVDFYDRPEGAILSELTFTPYGNMIYWIKPEILKSLGKKLQLPKTKILGPTASRG